MESRRPSRMGALAIGVALVLSTFVARADGDDAPESLFRKGATALRTGAMDEAVEIFEALADRGFVHPDASFDRSLSYLSRVRAGSEHPGDLGRAAAGLEETLLLRPDDHDAESALELVRAEVARRRARSGSSAEVESKPTLDRAIIGVASEWTWSILAMLSSALLTVGLALRALSSQPRGSADAPSDAAARENVMSLASAIAVPIGAICLLVFAGLGAGARHLRETTLEGVIVVPEAHLVTDKGTLTSAGPIPEAARVEVGEQRGSLVHVRWGAVEGFVPGDAVRRLSRP
ncbi:MAG TPA: hypothetical protein VGL13_08345 [Polyangiaceae bacterium]|jgi:hypothetical protein